MKRAAALVFLVGVSACSGGSSGTTPEEQPGQLTSAEVVAEALDAFENSGGPERSTDGRFDAVRELLRAGRTADAQARLEELAQDDATGEAAFLLGYLHHGAERWALALPWLRRAIEAGPRYPRARQVFFLYGRALQETGDLAGARAAYSADAGLFPDQADGLYRLALLDLEAGELETCEARARTCLERFQRPRDLAKSHALIGDVERARGDDGAARAAYEQCVGLFPHYEVFYKLARTCERLGDAEAAARYLELHRQWRRQAGR